MIKTDFSLCKTKPPMSTDTRMNGDFDYIILPISGISLDVLVLSNDPAFPEFVIKLNIRHDDLISTGSSDIENAIKNILKKRVLLKTPDLKLRERQIFQIEEK